MPIQEKIDYGNATIVGSFATQQTTLIPFQF
jgi:hypothetical protein